MKIPLKDEIESLTGAFDHIQYIERVIETNQLELSLLSELQSQTRYLRDRLADDCLYMAVVGEASTGKSTFINALLGYPLLEARVLTMTTALPTKIKYGQQLTVEASFHCSDDSSESNVKVQQFTQADEPISIPEMPGINRLSLSELITALTTRNDLSALIDSLIIKFPSDFLKGGICIIDTPGADATEDMHAAVTRQAVAAADAAIIITPARQIVSSTLLDLIRNRLQLLPFLHRSLFLVTEMDLISEQERAGVLAGARQRLARGLKSVETLPPILCTSAQSVMDEIDGDGDFIVREAADRHHWQEQFGRLKMTLRDRLKQQRVTIISESLLRLLDNVLSALEIHLEMERDRLSSERAVLETAIIPDLDRFASQQHQDCYRAITTAATETKVWSNNAVEEEASRTLREIETGVNNASSLKALKSYLENDLSSIISRNQQSLQTKLVPHLSQLQQAAEEISQTVDRRFEAAYHRLESTQQAMSARNGTVKVSLSASDVVSSGSSSGAFTTASIGQRATGAAIAVVVGAFLIPGLGLLIPAILGSIFGGLWGPSLNERKQTLLIEIRPKLTSQFAEAKIKVATSVCQYEQALKDAVSEHVDSHVARYAQTVQAMRSAQQEEVSQMRTAQALLDRDRQDLSQRRNQVNLRQQTIGLVDSQAITSQISSV